MSHCYLFTTPGGQLKIGSVSGADPDGRKLAKVIFAMGREFINPIDIPDAVKSRVAQLFPNVPNELDFWRDEIHVEEYGGPVMPFRQCDELDLPAEQALRDKEPTFRDAWEDTGTKVEVHMPKARGIHMDAIRVVRNAELAAKDITFMRAVEAGDTDAQATIGTEKQVLRDIPQTFDLTTDNDTPEELKTKWPAELPARE